MIIQIPALRNIIRKTILEAKDAHRTIHGDIVHSDSIECLEDICYRIEDAEYNRDSYQRGEATRSYYNGVLANLRKKKRRLEKLHASPIMELKSKKKDMASYEILKTQTPQMSNVLTKNLDMIISNDISDKSIGFDVDENEVNVITKDETLLLKKDKKIRIARQILKIISKNINK